MSSAWQQWCRLCGKSNWNESSIDITTIGDLSFIIEQHFKITLLGSDDFHSSLLCVDCYEFVGKLQEFSEQCRRADLMFNKLIQATWDQQNDNNFLQMLRYEAGLDKEKKFNIECVQPAVNDLHFAESMDIANSQCETSPIRRRSTRRKLKIEASNEIDPLDNPINSVAHSNPNIYPDEHSNEDGSDEHTSEDDVISSISEKMNVIKRKPIKKKAKKKSKSKKKERGWLPEHLTCLLCSINFNDKKTFDEHMRKIHSRAERPFLCAQCPKRFISLPALIDHETLHLPEDVRNIFPCEFCDKKFRLAELVKSHVRYVHTNTTDRVICEECGKDFVNQYSLKEHLQTHSDEFPIQCPQCPKRFKLIGSLRTHEDTHKNNTYKCMICGLELNTKVTLRRHMIVHSEQKKHKCQYCGNTYKRSKSLKTHLIIHTGLRPFSCLWCDKTFSQSANCRSHTKKTHPNELAAYEASGQRLPTVAIPKLSDLQPK